MSTLLQKLDKYAVEKSKYSLLSLKYVSYQNTYLNWLPNELIDIIEKYLEVYHPLKLYEPDEFNDLCKYLQKIDPGNFAFYAYVETKPSYMSVVNKCVIHLAHINENVILFRSVGISESYLYTLSITENKLYFVIEKSYFDEGEDTGSYGAEVIRIQPLFTTRKTILNILNN